MKSINIIIFFFLISFSNIYANTFENKTYHPHKEIITSVQNYIDTHVVETEGVTIKTTIGNLDKRLKLAVCDHALNASSHNGASFNAKVSVLVKCEGTKPWSLYLQVKIQRFASVFTSARPIAKGDQIGESDIQMISQDLSQLRRSYYKSKHQIIGKIAKRTIKLGSTFNPRFLKQAIIIKKGDMVDIVAETRGLTIRMSGKAIGSGVRGQKISVKNLSSKRIIQAVVEDPGLVKIFL